MPVVIERLSRVAWLYFLLVPEDSFFQTRLVHLLLATRHRRVSDVSQFAQTILSRLLCPQDLLDALFQECDPEEIQDASRSFGHNDRAIRGVLRYRVLQELIVRRGRGTSTTSATRSQRLRADFHSVREERRRVR